VATILNNNAFSKYQRIRYKRFSGWEKRNHVEDSQGHASIIEYRYRYNIAINIDLEKIIPKKA
jgi:hypothetical protein